VNIAFLCSYGSGQTPQLNLTGHSDPYSNACTNLSADITSCQSGGVKAMLSIGGGGYFFNSKQDAFQLAQYIWDNFLGGTSDKRPLGDAVLDGVDFNIEGGNPDYYGALAAYLKSFGSKQGKSSKKEVLLSAAPQCPFPGQWVGKALETGLFDYVQCGFSSTTTRSPCQYTPGSMDNLVKAWNQWTIRGSMRHTSSSACRLHRTRRGVGSSSRRQASTRRYDASGAQELHQVRRRDALVQVLR
jgi:chitinase